MLDARYEETAAAGFGVFCGVDEAGRGPLAGPVCAAAVILPRGFVPEGLDDSKKLTPLQRERLYGVVTRRATAWSWAFADEREIDRMNILQATFVAMRRAVEKLAVRPQAALVDGNGNPRLQVPTRCIVHGDALCPSIAAASIVAKVTRDRFMVELDRQYPQYGFAGHKGYPTKLHYERLDRYGASPVHRRSFLKKWEARKAGEEAAATAASLGRLGEQAAARMLERAGYQIVCRNYRCRFGEIDIIARDRKYIVFVEVKTRSDCRQSLPREAVDAAKRARLIRTAEIYLMQNGMTLQPRFDVVEAVPEDENGRRGFRVRHFPNAFTL